LLHRFGTGADEKRIGREQFRFQAERDWSQTEALVFNFAGYHISAAGPVAWVAAEGLGQGKVGGQKVESMCPVAVSVMAGANRA
jgi:hypothetical protein